MNIPRFRCLPRKRRGEFGFGILDLQGREVTHFVNEGPARECTRILNENELTPDRVADVEIKSSESIRQGQLEKYRSAVKARI
jgi:hypothetical protein